MVTSTLYKVFKYLFKKPYTRLVPELEPPLKVEGIRGRHVLDMNKCTGCSMCQAVCPANSIDMVFVEGNWPQNKRNRFPRIDLHKCTFCGLCVEYCPFGALSMTNITGFELYTKDKKDTLYYPTELSKTPEDTRIKISVTKEKFKVPEETSPRGDESGNS